VSALVNDLRGPGGRLPRLGRLLAPLGWLYGVGAALNGAWQASRAVHCRKPVVALGNLELGGTGKTPATLALAELLLAAGRRPGILTGLWGPGRNRGLLRQDDADFADLAPDEALLYAARLPGLPLAAASRKWQGAQALDADPACDLILLDDGFQHRRLHRDLDLLLIGEARNLSMLRVLPAGPLREFPGALDRADALLLPTGSPPPRRGRQPLLEFELREGALTDLTGASVTPNETGYLLAAGIARPERFEASAQGLCDRLGVELAESLRFEDHAPWSPALRRELAAARARHPEHAFLITEKDARRWASFWDLEGPAPHVLGLDLIFCEPERLLALLAPLYSASSA
jgi:tetraacyldisaccharide 4'-kinase